MPKEETSVAYAHEDDADYVTILDDQRSILICYKRPLSSHHQVYHGKQILQDGTVKPVAIKQVFPSEKNKREIEILLKLPPHDNTIKYICYLEARTPPAWYIVMELCKENLYQLVQQTGSNWLTLETKKIILRHIATGLYHIHQNDILHRDLKPQNLLLSSDGFHIKVCDFGLSRQVSEIDVSVTKSAKHIGTEGWGSPESYTIPQEDSEEVNDKMSRKSDVFSAGLIFSFVMSDGKHPCGEDSSAWTLAIKSETPITVSDLTISRDVTPCEEALIKHLISNMLSKIPAKRPKSKEVLCHALFWEISKRIDFIVYVHSNIKRIKNNLLPKVKIQKDWIDRLKGQISQESDSAEWCTTALNTKVEEAISKKKGNEEPLFLFLNFFNDCYSGFIKPQKGDQTPFKSLESLWTYFFNGFPQVFLDIFNWYWKNLPENLSEEFGERFGTKPTEIKLIPAIDDIKTQIEGRDIHISWAHSSEEPVTYRIRAFSGDNKLDETDVTGKKYTIKDAKSSSNLQIKIYAENERGSRSPVRGSKINTPPGKPENVSAILQNSTIVVTWTASEDDSKSEFFVRVNPLECPRGKTESTVVKVTSRPFKLSLPLPSRIYKFNVYAVSPEKLEGPESDSVSVETSPSRVCDIRVTVSESTRSFNITWNNTANESVTFRLQVYCNGEPEGQEVALTSTEYEFTDATTDNQYEFEVWAENNFGSKAAGKKTRTNKQSLPPKMVEDAKIQQSGQSLKIEWKPLAADVKYRVQVLNDNNVLEDTCTIEPHYEITAPTPKINYQFKIWARNKHGVDGRSVTVGPTTTTSSIVQGVSIGQMTDGLHLSWKKLESQDVKEYRIQIFRRNISNETEKQEVTTITTKDTKYKMEIPTPSMEYMFTVQAIDSWNVYGPTTPSKWVATAPAKVEDLHLDIDEKIKNYLRATWKKIDNHAYKVRVFRDGVRGDLEACNTEEHKFTAERNRRYFVKVSAINKGSIMGPDVQSNTTMLAPEKVKMIQTTLTDDNKICFRWHPSSQATSYIVELYQSSLKKSIDTKETDETEYLLQAEPSSQYKCIVTAKNQYNVAGLGTESEFSTPPPAISAIESHYEDQRITFGWPPVPQAVRYHLELKKEMRNKKVKFVSEHDIATTAFSVRAGPSERYLLTVQAKDKNGVANKPILCDQKTPPLQVKIKQITHKKNKIILTWEKLDDPGVQYWVRTFTNGEGPFPENNYEKTTFELGNPEEGEYYFEVWAINWLGVEGKPTRSHRLITDKSPETTTVQEDVQGAVAGESAVTFKTSRRPSDTDVAAVAVIEDRALDQRWTSSRVETTEDTAPLRANANEDEDYTGCFGRMRRRRKSARQRTKPK